VHDGDAEAGDWVVLGIEHVEARAPRRPWSMPDLEACVAMVAAMARTLTPPPPALELDDFTVELAEWPAYWDRLRADPPAGLPGFAEHVDEAAVLAAGFAAVCGGDTVVHTDIRDDNLLLTTDGPVLLCDWNWPVRGAAWLDTVLLMIGPRGDGLDVDAVLAGAAVLDGVPAEAVDALLALVTAYFLFSATLPVPPTSPHMRDAQRWQGEVCWRWLADRRGWA
jgi:aminoglycoside phosphotransferase (APT) family kinase protein